MLRGRNSSVALAAWIGGLTLASAALVGCAADASFDSAQWQAERGNATGESARQGLVTAAERAALQPGTPRADVRRLLGVPDGESAVSDVYALGRSAVGVDHETLVIVYSPDGRVRSHRIERD